MKYPGEESSTLEFKGSVPANEQIVKTIIGFCNGNGGKLILGVEDGGAIVGLPEGDAQRLMEYLNKCIFESSSPPIIPAVYLQRIADRILLVIEVSAGMNKPYYRSSEGLAKGTYIRLGRCTLRATADMIEELKWYSSGRSFDAMAIYHAREEDLDETKMLKFFNSRKRAKVDSPSLELLASYQLVLEEHAMRYPTVGGVLLFGKEPQRFLSEAMILCSHFSGTSGREAIASVDCTGTLFEQFNLAYDFIVGRLNRSFSIHGPKREEELEIPEEAIREVLLNAIVHRNYHIPAPTKIAIYENRIELFSPGTFPGPLDTNNLKMGLTYIRNRTICKVFREARYIEKLGSGFITLFESYEKRGLPVPEVIEGENFIKCILPRAPVKASMRPRRIGDLPEDEMKILDLYQLVEELSISDVMEALHLSRTTAGRRLSSLVEKGLLLQKGQGKATRYRLDAAKSPS